MDRQKNKTSKQRQEPSHKPFEPPPYPNDWLEFAILVVVGFGVGGAMFAMLYLMHDAGVI